MATTGVDPSYRNASSCANANHNHQWPTSGFLEIERCEHFCLFCTGNKALKHWNSAWFLRRHVRDYHVKHEYPELVVSEGWQARPTGNTRPVNKKQRAPGSNKKRAGTKKQHAARVRESQMALYNSLGHSHSGSSSSSIATSASSSFNLGTGSISTYPTSFGSQPYYSASNDSSAVDLTNATTTSYDFEFDVAEQDLLKQIGAFLIEDKSAKSLQLSNIAHDNQPANVICNQVLSAQPAVEASNGITTTPALSNFNDFNSIANSPLQPDWQAVDTFHSTTSSPVQPADRSLAMSAQPIFEPLDALNAIDIAESIEVFPFYPDTAQQAPASIDPSMLSNITISSPAALDTSSDESFEDFMHSVVDFNNDIDNIMTDFNASADTTPAAVIPPRPASADTTVPFPDFSQEIANTIFEETPLDIFDIMPSFPRYNDVSVMPDHAWVSTPHVSTCSDYTWAPNSHNPWYL